MENENQNENINESQSENQLKNENVAEETQIKKKKSFIPIIIAVVVLIIAGVIVYFSFFSEAAVRDREIKAHIASAEKYIDDFDYEKALAEYEAILKLDPSREDVLDDYTETAFAWSEDVADDDLEKAIEILEDTIKFLEKNASENGVNDEYIEKLQNKLDEYISNLEDADDDETDATDDESDVVDVDEGVEVANYTSEIIDVDGIVGDSWYWKVTPESIVCFDYTEYDPFGDGSGRFCYELTMRIYDYDGNLIVEVLFDDIDTLVGEGWVWAGSGKVNNFTVNVFEYYHNDIGIVVCINDGVGYSLFLYDYLGNFKALVNTESEGDGAGIYTCTLELFYGFDAFYETPLYFNDTVDDSYLAITLPSDCYEGYGTYSGPVVPVLYLNCDTYSIEHVYDWDFDNESLIRISETADHEMIADPEYDEEKFLYCSELKDVNSEAKYLIETIDEQWGYADKDFNILALYEDASGFNIYGYALVSDDRENYDLIDSEFNVIEENFVQGNSASTDNSHTMLVVVNGDDRTFYLVKGEND